MHEQDVIKILQEELKFTDQSIDKLQVFKIELLKANTEAHLNLSPRQNEVKVKAICSSLPNAKPNSLFHSYDTEEYLSKAQRETIITNIDAAWETFKNEGLTNNNNDLY